MKAFFRSISLLCAIFCVLLLGSISFLEFYLPSSYYLTLEDEHDFILPVNISAPCGENSYAEILKLPGSSYKAQLKLFNTFTIKEVDIDIVDETYLVPCGTPFGVKMYTKGVIVVGVGEIRTKSGYINPGELAGIEFGDVIISIDGKQVNSNYDVRDILQKSDGSELTVELLRRNEGYNVILKPVYSENDMSYKAGIWVRDSSAGIGTMTFYNPQTKAFGGLGHPICDVDTGDTLPILNGEIVEVEINEIMKSTAGIPGELRGSFIGSIPFGFVDQNTESGVYGLLSELPPLTASPIPVGYKHDVKIGPAKILTTVDSEGPKEYDIVIERISMSDYDPGKSFNIRVTDEELLSKTGGIVQGMSGSPIIQNGRLIGAVTHVFVNDPAKGFGIYIENMIKNTKQYFSYDKVYA